MGKRSSIPGAFTVDGHLMTPCPSCDGLKRAEAAQCQSCKSALSRMASNPNAVWVSSHAMIPCPDCGTLKRIEARQCKQCQYAASRSPLNYDLVQVGGENCRLVPLTKGLYSIVGESDYDWLMSYNWYSLQGTRGIHYACRHYLKEENGPRRQIFMHQQIMQVLGVGEVDHINHNGLDNRRSNLRLCTQQQNSGNTRPRSNNKSGFKGVSWNATAKKWMAVIQFNGEHTYLGIFSDPKDAARAYDAAALKSYGEFAWLNFPEEVPLGWNVHRRSIHGA